MKLSGSCSTTSKITFRSRLRRKEAFSKTLRVNAEPEILPQIES